MNNAVGMLVGAVLLLAFSAMAGEAWQLPTQPEVVAAVAYLVTLGSVGLFVLVLLDLRGDHFEASGRTRRNPIDPPKPMIGQELACVRP